MPKNETGTHSWWRSLRRRLLTWYEQNHRPLPWRETRDPYCIWVSEIMLQQTQVATVLEYYRRFLECFPDVEALAAADESEVLRMWAGLGYYRRAKQLHAAAKKITDIHQGNFPREVSDIQALPGIGRYTAGAIASFAYQSPSPILEANTIRLFSRLLQLEADTSLASSQQRLWHFAESLVQSTKTSPDKLNQAVMELGSQVCLPKEPRCLSCPLQPLCPTFRQGLQHRIPVAKPKKTFIEESHILVVVRKDSQFLMRQNAPGEWWEGLWDFPRTKLSKRITPPESSPRFSPANRRNFEQDLLQQLDLDVEIQNFLFQFRHGVTKYKIQLFCFEATSNAAPRLAQNNLRWLELPKVQNLPLTSSASKVLKRLRGSSPKAEKS